MRQTLKGISEKCKKANTGKKNQKSTNGKKAEK